MTKKLPAYCFSATIYSPTKRQNRPNCRIQLILFLRNFAIERTRGALSLAAGRSGRQLGPAGWRVARGMARGETAGHTESTRTRQLGPALKRVALWLARIGGRLVTRGPRGDASHAEWREGRTAGTRGPRGREPRKLITRAWYRLALGWRRARQARGSEETAGARAWHSGCEGDTWQLGARRLGWLRLGWRLWRLNLILIVFLTQTSYFSTKQIKLN